MSGHVFSFPRVVIFGITKVRQGHPNGWPPRIPEGAQRTAGKPEREERAGDGAGKLGRQSRGCLGAPVPQRLTNTWRIRVRTVAAGKISLSAVPCGTITITFGAPLSRQNRHRAAGLRAAGADGFTPVLSGEMPGYHAFLPGPP